MNVTIDFTGSFDDDAYIHHHHGESDQHFEIALRTVGGRTTIYMTDDVARALSAAIQSEFVADALAVPEVVLGGDITSCDHCGQPVVSDGDVRESAGGERHLEWWRHAANKMSYCHDAENNLQRAQVNGTRRVDGAPFVEV